MITFQTVGLSAVPFPAAPNFTATFSTIPQRAAIHALGEDELHSVCASLRQVHSYLTQYLRIYSLLSLLNDQFPRAGFIYDSVCLNPLTWYLAPYM